MNQKGQHWEIHGVLWANKRRWCEKVLKK